MTLFIFNFFPGEKGNALWRVDPVSEDFEKNFMDFFRIAGFDDGIRIDKLSIQEIDFLAGSLRYKQYLLVLCKNIPEDIAKRAQIFTDSLADHKRLANTINELKSNSGMYLFGLMLFIVLVSVLMSLYLSKNITKPVLKLSEAAQDVAKGNFDVSLYRESEDELGTLFKSFNRMVYELNRNRKIIYQKQRLEAWREMARQGGDPQRVNPDLLVDLVIDHSVQVDAYGSTDALRQKRMSDHSTTGPSSPRRARAQLIPALRISLMLRLPRPLEGRSREAS